jgi:NhaP-type Na+/H+ or K+/H+ antiporter
MAVSIAEIIVLGLLADWILNRFHIPGLIGMLLVGVVLGPQVIGYLDPDLMAIGGDLRLIALIVILLRVGFNLSRRTLHQVGGKVLLLAFVPATCEGLMITFVAPALLGLSLLESALLASVLAAVSPAVVVPSMIHFIEERRGAEKHIPSMVMAAASVDDIYVVVAHSVILGLYVGQDVNIGWQVASIPISLVLGIGVGIAIGVALYRLFDRFNPRATKRVLIVISLSILLIRLQHLLEGVLPFAGLISAMAIGYVILEKREHMAHEISGKLGKIWVFAAIILFSMVGAQVNVKVAWNAGLAAIGVIGLGLAARAIGVFLCLLRSELTMPERSFVAVSYSPKATVQAAIGAAPLMAMQMNHMDTYPGEVILAVAVLSIFLTAPAGAWGIGMLGRRILAVAPESVHDAYDAAMESEPDDERM